MKFSRIQIKIDKGHFKKQENYNWTPISDRASLEKQFFELPAKAQNQKVFAARHNVQYASFNTLLSQ